MIAQYTVKVNGEWYRMGSEIPTCTNKEPEPVKPVEVVNKPTAEPFYEVTEEPEKLTRTKITTMNVAGLQELAERHGIENARELTGSKLKEILIEKLGL